MNNVALLKAVEGAVLNTTEHRSRVLGADELREVVGGGKYIPVVILPPGETTPSFCPNADDCQD
jgi:hypothetical protein